MSPTAIAVLQALVSAEPQLLALFQGLFGPTAGDALTAEQIVAHISTMIMQPLEANNKAADTEEAAKFKP